MRKKQRFIGWHLIRDEKTFDPYMFRAWIGRLRLHIFYRGDHDPDPHDHPWDFWTFPFTSYVEEAVNVAIPGDDRSNLYVYRQVVPAFRLTHRPAEYCHRVLGRYSGNRWDDSCNKIRNNVPADYPHFDHLEPFYDERKIVTLVWRGRLKRDWGFLKTRDGRWCWVHFKEYIWGGGKSAPCDD